MSKQVQYNRTYYKKHRAITIEILGSECWVCGFPVLLEIHHADNNHRGEGRGSLKRLADWKAELAKEEHCNLQLLCDDCHTLYHKIDKMISNSKLFL